MSIAMWPALVMPGVVICLVAGVLALFGTAASAVKNERLGDRIFVIAVPLVLLGVGVIILGVGGWWAVGGAALLAAFGLAVRPRPSQAPVDEQMIP